jgi:glucuronosyltransferase
MADRLQQRIWRRVSTYSVLLYLSSWFSAGQAARILMASPELGSHVMIHVSLAEELVRRGHEVHIVLGSRYPKKDSILQSGIQIQTYHVPDDVIYALSPEMERLVATATFEEQDKMRSHMFQLSALLNRHCELMMTDRKFIGLVKNLHFDLAVVETFSVSPCVLVLPFHLDVPFVTLGGGFFPWDIGVPALPSFTGLPGPRIGVFGFPDFTTFGGRLRNSALFLIRRYIVMSSTWKNTTLLEQFGGGNVTSWVDALRQSQLFLIDNDHHLELPVPMMPNTVAVAGLIVKAAKPLSSSLELIFSESGENGVILVSFGSMAYYLPDNVIRKFFDSFSRLKQTIIARFAAPDGIEVPKNVKLMSWLPQNDILGHNKTRLFITHCGRNGQHEALYNGVPMLGFPLFAEQTWNCDRAVAKGLGLTMDIKSFTASELYENIQIMLDNPSYSKAIKKLSAIFRDQPMYGREKAAYWIEHVIKHGGNHLRTAATDMPLYQFLMFDIIVAGLIVITVCVSLFAVILKCVITKCLKTVKFKKE